MNARGRKEYAHRTQHAENTLPAGHFQHRPADDGGRHGGYAVNRADDGQGFGQVGSFKFVRRYRAGNHNSARGGNALQQAQRDEDFNRGGKNTRQCGDQEQNHGRQKRFAAAEFIAQRAEHNLPCRQPQHGERKPQLHEGRAGVEVERHGRKAGQVHIGYERAERGKHAQKDKNKKGRIAPFFGGTLPGFLFCFIFYIVYFLRAKIQTGFIRKI